MSAKPGAPSTHADPHVYKHASLTAVSIVDLAGGSSQVEPIPAGGGALADFTFGLEVARANVSTYVDAAITEMLLQSLLEERPKHQEAQQYSWPKDAREIQLWAHAASGAASVLRAGGVFYPARLIEAACSTLQKTPPEGEDLATAEEDLNAMLKTLNTRFGMMLATAQELPRR